MKRESYDVLGLRRNAPAREIKAAYRRLARIYHPDMCGNSPEAAARFREINEAYQRLSLPRRPARDGTDRARAFGEADLRAASFNLSDIFGEAGLADLFGLAPENDAPWWPEPVPGGDVSVEIAISIEDAMRGARRALTVRVLRRCEPCAGRGSLDRDIAACGRCNGSGRLAPPARPPGRRPRAACPFCAGRGVVFENPCPGCHGAGRVVGTRTVVLDLPAGPPEPRPIRLRGQGHDGEAGGVAGDLHVGVKLATHPVFEARGWDLYSEVEIGLQEAIFGGTVRVETVYGPRSVRIRPGAQSHGLYRLKGFGLPRRRGAGRGDQLIRLVARIPGGLEGEKALLLRDLLASLDEPDLSGAI